MISKHKAIIKAIIIELVLTAVLIFTGIIVSSPGRSLDQALDHSPVHNTGRIYYKGNGFQKTNFSDHGANRIFPSSCGISYFTKNLRGIENPLGIQLVKKPVIVIDPGHGGEDMGTVKNGLIESRINLDIARRLYKLLNSGKYTIHMTRIGDSSLDKLSEVEGTFEQKDLDARMRYIKGCNADLLVSLHLDSFPESPSLSGSIAYYHGAGCPGSQELAEYIQESLNDTVGKSIGRPVFNAREGNFFLLRNSPIPAVLVETAFITGSNDQNLLRSEDFRNKIAAAIAKGIENWLKIN